MKGELISINEAIDRRITKVRLPIWATPSDHLELHITESGHIGPWVKLWSIHNEMCEQENPHALLYMSAIKDPSVVEWEIYEGGAE
jgi:hypothetical protein